MKSLKLQEQHYSPAPPPPPAGVRDIQLGPQRRVGSKRQQGKVCTQVMAQRQEQKTMVEASEHYCGAGNREGVRDGQGGLACCDSWGLKELDMTEQLN